MYHLMKKRGNCIIHHIWAVFNLFISFRKEWILQVMKCKKWKRFGMYLFNYCMKKYSHYKDFKPWAEEVAFIRNL